MDDKGTFVPGQKGVSKQVKEEAARDIGVTLSDYNPNLRARDAGRIGGKIGGGITKNLIAEGKKRLGQ